ncbi:DUF4255 domain-containing protein [Propionibacteriaceae bacterium Y2011]
MLNLLDGSLAAFLRAKVPLATKDVEIAFEAPDREWGGRVTRPTVNLYLWDVRPNLAERELGIMTTTTDEYGTRRHGPRPKLDCRYLVTAWTSEVDDEHALLGRVMTALLINNEIDEKYCKGPLSTVAPLPQLALAPNSGDNSDFWSALGGQLKPGLDLVVTVTVDALTYEQAGPPVETVEIEERIGVDRA